MAVDIKGYRIFIASPRGLEDERQKFFDAIQEYNHTEALPVNLQFIPVGWEYVLPGMGRPQSLINEEVQTCDYFVLVLWDRWGSPPDKKGEVKYTSGTEEEYHVALDCFADVKYPMRQIVALFKAVDERRLNDPGPELQKVLDFKKNLEDEKTILFKSFEGSNDFERVLRSLLGQWRRDSEQGKTAKVVKPEVPLPSGPFGKPAESERTPEAVTSGAKTIVKEAQKLADEGNLTDAEVLFAKAAVNTSEPYAYTAYGNFLMRVGRLDQALVMHERALDIATKMADQGGIAVSYGNLGLVYETRGELDNAEKMHKKALEIDKQIGNKEGMAEDYGNLGLVYKTRSELDNAEQMFQKTLEIHNQMGSKEGQAKDYGNLGNIYFSRGDLDNAEDMYKQSLKITEKLGMLETSANQYGNLGNIYSTRGDLDESEEMHKKALEINKQIGRLEGQANQYSNLGNVYQIRGDLDNAEEMYKKALEINQKIGRIEGQSIQYGNLGNVYLIKDDLNKAEEMHKKALEIDEQMANKEGMAQDYSNLGALYKQRGDKKKAKEYWQKSLALYNQIGIAHMAAKIQSWLDDLDKK